MPLAARPKPQVASKGEKDQMEKKFRKSVSEILLPDILDGEGDIIPIIADGDDGELEDV